MKKSIIASSMLLALMGSAAAQAEMPTFYGAMRMAVTNADTGFASNIGGGEGTTIENDFSLVGIKGNVALNDALALVYKAEVMVRGEDSDASNPFSSRDTYLGMKGGFGELTFGKMGQAFWKAEGGVDKFNLTNTDINRLFSGNSRHGDMISFTSPSLGGVTVIGTYQLEDDAYGADADIEGDLYSVAALYGDKKLAKKNYFVAVAYNAGIGGDEAYRVTGQVKLGQVKLGAMFQDTQDLNNKNLDGNGFAIDASYPLTEKLSLKARYGQDDSGNGKYAGNVMKSLSGLDKADVTVAEVTNYAVGADYKLSKAAKVYAHYSRFDAEIATAGAKLYDEGDNIFSMGLHYKF
ncbi:Outer membrane protein (porin) [Ferrimonas sediminum]|uniref:Outer membrane protein (Porin) n=1 Tax=Ferrimonas sediminum TaxID=718193 RepID=A0A1G8NEC8_9GAMM|nr:porin [Ferrimonas sediminum]SDI78518.1 Outer membrane protein (porin) [Ferrimonas sediminum]